MKFIKIKDELISFSDTNLVTNMYKKSEILSNLLLYLEYIYDNWNKQIFVGEAPGWRGAKLSGIPFTSTHIILEPKHKIWKDLKSKLYIPYSLFEHTANIVWETIPYNQDKYPLFWNVFPFHPHKPNIENSNDSIPRELKVFGEKILLQILDIFKTDYIYAVGLEAKNTLDKFYPFKNIEYIRHPSFGGKELFQKRFKELISISIC